MFSLAARVWVWSDKILFDLFRDKLDTATMYTVPSIHVGAGGVALPPEPRLDDSIPLTQLGLDSLDAVEFMVAVEQNFQIELSDEDHEAVRTIDDLVNIIRMHPRAQ